MPPSISPTPTTLPIESRASVYTAASTFAITSDSSPSSIKFNDSSTSLNIYERTYEIGPRYVLHFGRFEPYAAVFYGRGVFNFPSVGGGPNGRLGANLAYNLEAAGGGVDYRLRRSINLRVDYEFQNWMGFPPHGLTPTVLDFGAAYHFH